MTAYEVAARFVGVKETPGHASTPLVLAMLQLDGTWPTDDAVPWCSAFLNFIAFVLGLPRSKSLAAISWQTVGEPIALTDAIAGNDIIVFPHHVGLFARLTWDRVYVLGGNQSDAVNVSPFPRAAIVAVRRLVPAGSATESAGNAAGVGTVDPSPSDPAGTA